MDDSVKKKDYHSQKKGPAQEVKLTVFCLPRFSPDVLESFERLAICSSASKSHCVKPEADSGQHFGSLNGSASKDVDNIADKSRQFTVIG